MNELIAGKTSVIIALIVVLSVMSHLYARNPNTVKSSHVEDEDNVPDNSTNRGRGSYKKYIDKRMGLTNIEDAGTTTRISSDDIDARSDQDLSDSLNMVPGMQVKQTLKGGKGFTMRGYSQDKVAVLIDGILINDAYDAKADISQIPIANISHLIVNRGVSSALYGTYGTIGSINIITKKPSMIFSEARAGYSSYDNYILSIAHGAPVGDFYYWITASMLNSNGYKPSAKLDKKKRREWLDKIVRYDLYEKDFNDISLKAVNTYLNDTGKWDHTGYRKYQLSGKFGYSATRRLEIGLSTQYYHNRKKTSMYDANLYSNYRMGMWNDPMPVSYTDDGKDAIFQVQARNWPEDKSHKVIPYLIYEGDKFFMKISTFYYWQSNTLESFASTDHSEFMYPAEVYYWDTGQNKAMRYFDNFYQSIHTDRSWGIQIMSSYKVLSWNRISASILLRMDDHLEEVKPFEDGSAQDIIDVHGTGTFESKYLGMHNLTVALEDEIQPVENLAITLGISYDAQNLTDHKRRSMDQDTLNEYVDGYLAMEDSRIWGTRDSFNPVIGTVFEPVKDLIILRAAASIKTKFPTLRAYSRISDINGDLKMKPERSYNGNIGIEFLFLKTQLRWRVDYFYSRFTDKIEQVFNEELGGNYFVNLEGVETQGIESIVYFTVKKIADMVDLSVNVSYVFVRSRNQDDTADIRMNMGDRFELTPEHQFTADIRFKFISGTSLGIFGKHTRKQIMYAMRNRPQTVTPEPYSTEHFKGVSMHNPLFINVKLSQRVFTYLNVYILCKNILDDYDADPFNPGPGRMWYFGGKASL